ncbi:helix-turn-helix domain-containing protein [Alkalihalobacillus trypoxylicola]|uniref:Transcriptional regulator n=1 Tax=Alkalihalobacillus trypoxylicola TaxID=519424 RepID=A0A161Q1S6_9BACI|nr:helix-turn-helix domain-containing protein [Alkalihalobacillus trypoxylicola]KYG29463.1 transcriptional regulator [Alkalihalobacillus trypoxylicola]
MKSEINKEVQEAIIFIQENLYNSIELEALAKHISYSPYHFSRLFKKETGMSPLYYVSSLRLQKAKELLLTTEFTIRDIGMEIGQQSLGTFTSRFSEKVGMTPGAFRRMGHSDNHHLQLLKRLSNWNEPIQAHFGYSQLTGTICSEKPFDGVTLIGLFKKPIPEGMPEFGTLISGTGDFVINNVKPGTYHLLVTALNWHAVISQVFLPFNTLRTRIKEPIIVKENHHLPHYHLTLRPPSLDDPPILISLPLLMQTFLQRVQQL